MLILLISVRLFYTLTHFYKNNEFVYNIDFYWFL